MKLKNKLIDIFSFNVKNVFLFLRVFLSIIIIIIIKL